MLNTPKYSIQGASKTLILIKTCFSDNAVCFTLQGIPCIFPVLFGGFVWERLKIVKIYQEFFL